VVAIGRSEPQPIFAVQEGKTMKTLITLCFAWLALGALAQENKVNDVSKLHDALPDKDYTAKGTDTSFLAPNGERVLREEIVVPATLQEVWAAVSTSAGLRTFVAPVTEVEMKTGGHYYTNYNPGAKIDDPGTIYNTVLTYVPLEMVGIKVKLGTAIFPKSVADADTLFAVMTMKDLGGGQVRVTETMVGWQSGEDWDKVYKFFQTGNAYVLGQLYKRFSVGPRQWVAKGNPPKN
jgi:uncharacterized protein YndB with AHSA1/START domain